MYILSHDLLDDDTRRVSFDRFQALFVIQTNWRYRSKLRKIVYLLDRNTALGVRETTGRYLLRCQGTSSNNSRYVCGYIAKILAIVGSVQIKVDDG